MGKYRNTGSLCVFCVLTGVFCTLPLVYVPDISWQNDQISLGSFVFHFILICMNLFAAGMSAFMVWLDASQLEIQIKSDSETIKRREEAYSALLKNLLVHLERIDLALGRWKNEDAVPNEMIEASVRTALNIDWGWVDGNEAPVPDYEKLVAVVNRLKAYMGDQVDSIEAERVDVLGVTEDLFMQVEALWRLQPPQASVRDVRQAISNLAWRLAQHAGGYAAKDFLNRVSPNALRWLVRNRELWHWKHVQLLEHYVLHGTIQGETEETQAELPPTV